jgi:hypothetical protein
MTSFWPDCSRLRPSAAWSFFLRHNGLPGKRPYCPTTSQASHPDSFDAIWRSDLPPDNVDESSDRRITHGVRFGLGIDLANCGR